eukprot:TRINITY_DN3247_c1_g1_i3.p1 TRINITY_DN3247_c1_g1~~TRINITY_DN3247_c1_g1_i3.p1  ORF type:complete len:411 (+),score=61.29 TRINITY_DN3247_c1_g1_i3:724-1956(+)
MPFRIFSDVIRFFQTNESDEIVLFTSESNDYLKDAINELDETTLLNFKLAYSNLKNISVEIFDKFKTALFNLDEDSVQMYNDLCIKMLEMSTLPPYQYLDGSFIEPDVDPVNKVDVVQIIKPHVYLLDNIKPLVTQKVTIVLENPCDLQIRFGIPNVQINTLTIQSNIQLCELEPHSTLEITLEVVSMIPGNQKYLLPIPIELVGKKRPIVGLPIFLAFNINTQSAVFGLPLSVLPINEECGLPEICVLLKELFYNSGCQITKGTFRVQANSDELKSIMNSIDQNDIPAGCSPHVSAMLINQFLSRLPDDLIENIAMRSLADVEFELAKLSKQKQEILWWLARILGDVAFNIENTLMSSKNLATIVAPVLIREKNSTKILQASHRSTAIVYWMTEYVLRNELGFQVEENV